MNIISLRKIKNLLKRKEKDFKSNISYSNIDYDILVASCPNISLDMDIDKRDKLLYSMSHIAIRFTISKSNQIAIDNMYNLYEECIRNGVSIYIDTKLNNIYNIYISSNYNSINNMLNTKQFTNNLDNEFFTIFKNISYSFLDNLIDYTNDETSFELIDPADHRSSRKRYDDYISRNPYELIEVLGYTLTDYYNRSSTMFYATNCIWLSIHENLINEFSSISTNQYIEEGVHRALIKMSLNEFILQMNKDDSTISENTFSHIKNIFDNDSKYFKPIYNMIHWNKYENNSNSFTTYEDDIIESNNEDENLISQEEFINDAIDEIIK